MISLDEALQRINAAIAPPRAEAVALAAAAGRVLAAPLTAGHSQPPFDASSMDGYAVRARDVEVGSPLRLIGTAQAGQRFSGMMAPRQCVRIFTGAPLPIGADAVVIQELAESDGAEVSFAELPVPGQNVRLRGSVFADNDVLLPIGTLVTPARLALIAAANRNRVEVACRPRIAVVATGDELVPPGTALGLDQIASSNTFGLLPLLAPCADTVTDLGIVRDDPERITSLLGGALDAGVDVLVTTGGASVGDRDFMQQVWRKLGVSLDFWQLAIRPGKPLMFGTRDGTLIFGLPGNPVAAMITATLVVVPTLRQMLGQLDPLGPRLRLPLAAPLPPNGPRRHFWRARFEPAPHGTEVLPFMESDSGHIASLAAADGLVVQMENDPGLPAGAFVDVIPL